MGSGWVLRAGLVIALGLGQVGGVVAQTTDEGGVLTSPRPKLRPTVEIAAEAAPAVVVAPEAAAAPAAKAKPAPRDPSKGAVTSLPIPRFVSLKGTEGNARRGPSLTHRIDWVFTTPGMPLRVTAEHENWRRVEDAEGMGGWVHYALLSGVRTALVTAEMAKFYSRPDTQASITFEAESGVTGRLLECQPDWCRMNIQGEKGWVEKTALWGVLPGEVLE